MHCLVGGSVCTKDVDALEIRLRDLSGVPKIQTRIHKLVLKSGTNLGLGAPKLHVLCNLEQPEPTWVVRYVESWMEVPGRITNYRAESKTMTLRENPLPFFYGLGYKLDYEILKVGFKFHFQRRGVPITVSVRSRQKMLKLHATDEAVPLTPGIQLVNIDAFTTADNYNEAVAEVSSLCECLAPLVNLSKNGGSRELAPVSVAQFICNAGDD